MFKTNFHQCVCFAIIASTLGCGSTAPADVWDAFLDRHDNNKTSKTDWESVPEIRDKLTAYLKAKIDAGVRDGKTSFPFDLSYFMYHFPEEMLRELIAHAESILKTDPNNGAAVQFLAIEAFQRSGTKPFEKYPLLEKAMVLAPKDVEICFFAFTMCSWGAMEQEALVSLERLLDRLNDFSDEESYHWVDLVYTHYDVFTTPSEFYIALDSDHPLIERWRTVLDKIFTVFENKLRQDPGATGAFEGVANIYETLGNIKSAQAVFEKRLREDPSDWSALHGLANIHETLGNSKLAREYRTQADPTLAWEGQVLPDFSATTDLDGKPISIADYRGKIVLLDFWAVWCGPCVGEIPDIKEVYKKYHHKGFDVIGISLDTDEVLLRKFIEENRLPWRQIFDGDGFDGPIVEQYGVRAIPAPLLLNRDGKVISVNARGSRLEELVAAEIERKMD